MDSFFPFSTKIEEKQREYWRKSTAKKVMFEWSNLRILSTDWSIRIILQDPMLHSESEGVKYYVYRGGNMALRRYEISLQICVEKYFVSERSEQVKYFSTWEKKFVSPSSHVMFYLFYKHQLNTKPSHFKLFLLWNLCSHSNGDLSHVKMRYYFHKRKYHVLRKSSSVFYRCLYNKTK